MELKEKRWDRSFERPIYEEWKKSGAFRFVPKEKIFSIDTPPPYVNSPIHIGYAATCTMMDFFARFHRMKGKAVLFPFGLDRNGLPIEVAAEKRFGVTLNEVSREEFLEMCKKVLDDSTAESIDSLLMLGISFNSWEPGPALGDLYYTDSVEYRTLTQSTFIDLWNSGLVYEDERINNYCPGCRTTIADSEIERIDAETWLDYVNFPVKGSEDCITIATTRPELLCTSALIVVNPKDDRYKKFVGKTAVTPVFENEVEIIEHPIADPEFGTGAVFMSASGGDQDAVRFLREMGMEPRVAVNIDGTMNEKAGFLEGLTTQEARSKIVECLSEEGFLVDKKKIIHSIPICERSKHPIEFVSMKEFYLKQVEFKEDVREMSEKMNFFSPRSRQILLDWINSVSIDWPISRRRYYATEIPLWYCKECGKTIVPPKGKYYQPWREPPPGKMTPDGRQPVFKCSCGSSDFRGEERVFDTWFDSSNSPLYITKWPGEFYESHRSVSLRPQGKEIVRTWLYYSILKCYLLTKTPIFSDVWIHNHIVDDEGKKMSKSIGNVIDPHEILEKFGAEPFRLWCAVEGDLTKGDLRCSFERIEGASKTLTKLWNVARFVSQFPQAERPEQLAEADVWIINEMNRIVENADRNYAGYDFSSTAMELRHFLWETFASHYLETAKSRAYNNGSFSVEEQNSALYTLHQCLKMLLLSLAPIAPFITQKLFKDIYGKNVHGQVFPETLQVKKAEFATDELIDINSRIWKAKKDSGLSLRDPMKELVVDKKFAPLEKDLAAAHNIGKITYGSFEIIL